MIIFRRIVVSVIIIPVTTNFDLNIVESTRRTIHTLIMIIMELKLEVLKLWHGSRSKLRGSPTSTDTQGEIVQTSESVVAELTTSSLMWSLRRPQEAAAGCHESSDAGYFVGMSLRQILWRLHDEDNKFPT